MHLQEFVILTCQAILSYICIRNPSLFFIFFHPLTWHRNANVKPSTRAHLCALEVGFLQVAKKCQVFCQIIGEAFSMFLPKIKDANPIWQTVEDAMRGRVQEHWMLL